MGDFDGHVYALASTNLRDADETIKALHTPGLVILEDFIIVLCWGFAAGV